MTTRTTEGKDQRAERLANVTLPMGVALAFFVANGWFNWRRFIFEADRDEGYALIQALLVDRGHTLYSEIWSDQPPGYTYLAWGFTQLFGETPEVARLLTLLLVAGSLAALFDLARRAWPGWGGHVAGLVAAGTVVCSEDFIRYSCAAMIGLPSLALAVIAWALLDRSQGRARWDASAGLLLALSLSVKPLSAPAAVPLTLFALVGSLRLGDTWRARAQACAPFFGALVFGLVLGFGPVLLTPGGETLWEVHRLESQEAWPGWEATSQFLRSDAWMLLPAAACGLLLLIRRNAAGVVGVAWAGLALLALSRYSPVWSHHRYVLLFPAAALCGLGVGELGRMASEARGWVGRWVAAALFAGLAVVSRREWPEDRAQQLARYYEKEVKPSRAVRTLDKLHALAPRAHTMTTFRQMQAYRLGLEVPPQLAVTSRKRFTSGELNAKTVARLALEADSDIVAIDNRWPRGAQRRVKRVIRKTHRRVLKKWKQDQFYVRRSLIQPAAR